MEIQVRCFATLREASAARTALTVASSATVAAAWSEMESRFPALAPHRAFTQPARNGVAVGWDEPLADGDEVAFLPPVSGGSDPTLIGLSADPIDVAALERVVDRSHGAVVTFVGRARNRSDDGREVTALEYEAYPEMADATLRVIADEVTTRWPDCVVAVVHRTGTVPIGEAAVAIVTGAPHRGDAYDANRYVIEAIKDRLPIWKLEQFTDGSRWKRPGA
jgi:molybdopterin synthase catalytic subunit